jgi:hypothetical protein
MGSVKQFYWLLLVQLTYTNTGHRTYLCFHPALLVLVWEALAVWVFLNPLLGANNCGRLLIKFT